MKSGQVDHPVWESGDDLQFAGERADDPAQSGCGLWVPLLGQKSVSLDLSSKISHNVMSMHVISRKALRAFADDHPEARRALADFFHRTESAHWRHFAEVKATFGQTDQARVASGNSVAVFDIGGNKWRVIAAIHYNTQSVFILRILTHEQYDDNTWKRQL